MHHDGRIKDRTTGIKGCRGPHNVGSSPLFARDVDELEPSNEDRTGDLHEIVGSWPTIIARSWLSMRLHRIGRFAIIARFFIKRCFIFLCISTLD